MKQILITPLVLYITCFSTECNQNAITFEDSIQKDTTHIQYAVPSLEENAYAYRNKKKKKLQTNAKHSIKMEVKSAQGLCSVTPETSLETATAFHSTYMNITI